jgi:hypothetical protein
MSFAVDYARTDGGMVLNDNGIGTPYTLGGRSGTITIGPEPPVEGTASIVSRCRIPQWMQEYGI